MKNYTLSSGEKTKPNKAKQSQFAGNPKQYTENQMTEPEADFKG